MNHNINPDDVSGIEKALSVMSQIESSDDSQIEEMAPVKSNSEDDGVKDMEHILDNFNKAIEHAYGSDSESDKDIKQIKETNFDSKNNILSIGDFSIVKTDEGYYDLFDDEDRKLLSDVCLYETVYSVATYLYHGQSFNSVKVFNLLKANDNYEKYLMDAKINKRNYNKYVNKKDYFKQDLEETRFNENKSKAIHHKKTIIECYRNINK